MRSLSKQCKYCRTHWKTEVEARKCEEKGPAKGHKFKVGDTFRDSENNLYVIKKLTSVLCRRQDKHLPGYQIDSNEIESEWQILAKIENEKWFYLG